MSLMTSAVAMISFPALVMDSTFAYSMNYRMSTQPRALKAQVQVGQANPSQASNIPRITAVSALLHDNSSMTLLLI